ncbi:uncharacterized protein [Bemisia tabaci]|uniref:uncharacterized protein n=1 Tax=Bemisia tabaci TaxID=7038 RepID=UPI003B28AEFD
MLIPTATLLTLVLVAPEISGQMFPFSNLWHYFNGNTKLTGGGGGGGGGGASTGGGFRGILGGHKTNDNSTSHRPSSKNASESARSTTESTTLPATSPIATVAILPTLPVTDFVDTTHKRDTLFTFFPTERVTRPSLVQDHFAVTDESPRYQFPAEKRHDYEPEKSPSSDYNAYVDADEDYPAETPPPNGGGFTRRSYQTREPNAEDGSTEVYTTPGHVTRASFGDEPARYTKAPFGDEQPNTRAPHGDRRHQRTRAPFGDRNLKRTRAPFGTRPPYEDENIPRTRGPPDGEYTRAPFGEDHTRAPLDDVPFFQTRAPFDRAPNTRAPFDRAPNTRAPFEDDSIFNTRAPYDDEQAHNTRAPFDDEGFHHTEAPFNDEPVHNTRAPFGKRPVENTRAPFDDGPLQNTRAPFGRRPVESTRVPFEDGVPQNTRAPFGDRRAENTKAPFDYAWEIDPVPVEEIPTGRRKPKPTRNQSQKQKPKKQKDKSEEDSEEEISDEIFEPFKKSQKQKVPQRDRPNPKQKPTGVPKSNSKSDFGVFEQPLYLSPYSQPQNPFQVTNGPPNEGYMQIKYVNPISTPNPFTSTAYSLVPFTQAQDFTPVNPFDATTKRLPAYDATTPFKLDWNYFNNPVPAKPLGVYDPHQSYTQQPFQVPVPQSNPSFGHHHPLNPPNSNVESIYQPENPPFPSPTPPPSRVLATIRPLYSTPAPPVALTTTTPPHADYPVTHVIKYSKESPFHFPFLDAEEPIIESLPAISFALNEHKRAQHLEKDDVVDYLTPPRLELPPPKSPKSKQKKKKLPSRRNKNYKSLNDPEGRNVAEKVRTPPQFGDYGGENLDAIVPLAWGQDPPIEEEEEEGGRSEEKANDERGSNEEYDDCGENCDYNEAEDGGDEGNGEGEEEEEGDGEEEEKEEKPKKGLKKGGGKSKPEFDFSKFFPRGKKEEEGEEEGDGEEEEIEETVKNQKYHNPDENKKDSHKDNSSEKGNNRNSGKNHKNSHKDYSSEREYRNSEKDHKSSEKNESFEKDLKSPIKKTFADSDSRENFIHNDSEKRAQLRTRRPDSRGNILGATSPRGEVAGNSNSRGDFSAGASQGSQRSSTEAEKNGSVTDTRVKKSNSKAELDNQKQDFSPVPKFADKSDFDSGYSDDEDSDGEGEGGGEDTGHTGNEKEEGGDRVEFQMHGQSGPDSYKFGFDTGKGENRQFRYEEKENDGTIKGHYGYYDQHGKLHVVNYAAHPEHGFQAEPAT